MIQEERQAPFLLIAVDIRRPASVSTPVPFEWFYYTPPGRSGKQLLQLFHPGTPTASTTRKHQDTPRRVLGHCPGSVVWRPSTSLTCSQVEQVKGVLIMYLHPLRFRPSGVGTLGSLFQCILLGPGYNVIAFRIRVLRHDPYSQFHYILSVIENKSITVHSSTKVFITECSDTFSARLNCNTLSAKSQ